MSGKNKGEWTELYSFFKTMHEKKILLADKNLNVSNCNNFLSVTKVSTLNIEKLFHLRLGDRVIVESETTGKKKEIHISNFINENVLSRLFSKITNGTGSSFNIPEFNSIQGKLNVDIKKGGTSNQKADIVLDIKNSAIEKENEGFSIKSAVGKDPTLLNASLQTNFIYEVEGLAAEHLGVVNSITTGQKIKKRIKKIQELDGSFKYIAIDSSNMSYNLSMVDSIIPKLLSQMLLSFFVERNASIKLNLKKLYNSGCLSNFTNEDLQSFTVKIKRLLVSILLGFFPGKRWDGKNIANGVIIVKKNGEQVGLHVIDTPALENYLFENSRFETPSSSKHKYGELYECDDKIHLKFNLQLRLGV